MEDVDELSKSILFAQARCLHKHIMNDFIMSSMSGERSSRSQLSREKKEGLIMLFPAAFHFHCGLPPLINSMLLQLFSSSRLILFLYLSGSRVAEATSALWSFSVHIMNLFISDRVYLSGCLAAFNFEEFNYVFHLTIRSYLYIYIYVELRGAGPSGEEQCTPHYTVLVSP